MSMTEWKTIDSAPKDGTPILTYPHYRVTHWAAAEESMSDDGCWAGSYDEGFERYWCLSSVTHWMPLPKPPTE